MSTAVKAQRVAETEPTVAKVQRVEQEPTKTKVQAASNTVQRVTDQAPPTVAQAHPVRDGKPNKPTAQRAAEATSPVAQARAVLDKAPTTDAKLRRVAGAKPTVADAQPVVEDQPETGKARRIAKATPAVAAALPVLEEQPKPATLQRVAMATPTAAQAQPVAHEEPAPEPDPVAGREPQQTSPPQRAMAEAQPGTERIASVSGPTLTRRRSREAPEAEPVTATNVPVAVSPGPGARGSVRGRAAQPAASVVDEPVAQSIVARAVDDVVGPAEPALRVSNQAPPAAATQTGAVESLGESAQPHERSSAPRGAVPAVQPRRVTPIAEAVLPPRTPVTLFAKTTSRRASTVSRRRREHASDDRPPAAAHPSPTTGEPERPVMRRASNTSHAAMSATDPVPEATTPYTTPYTPPAPSQAERLAAATGGTIVRDAPLQTSVAFPAPAVSAPATNAASPVLARQPAAPPDTFPVLAPPRAPSPATSPSLARSTTAALSRPASSPVPAPAPERDRHEHFDDLYEAFMERLRRDLLHERERNGRLVDGLF